MPTPPRPSGRSWQTGCPGCYMHRHHTEVSPALPETAAPPRVVALDAGTPPRSTAAGSLRFPSVEWPTDLLAFVRSQVPLMILSPYEVTAPVTGSQFFGRETEIRRMINHPEP